MSVDLTYHPPQIGIRAAWFQELAAQSANYFPAVIGLKTWNTPPTRQTLDEWHHSRKGVLVVAQNVLLNLAVIQEGTQWLAAVQPVSWKVDNPAYATLYTPAAYGKTSLYPDARTVALIQPNVAIPDPGDNKIKGAVGRSLLITGTYADGSTITDVLIMAPQMVPDSLS